MPAISLVDERPEGFEAVKQRFPLIHVHYGDRPNLLLGIEGGFTDDELIAGLRHFYENWQASVDFPDSPPPDLILAQQNWGAGTSIWEALEELAGQHGIRIWRIYPVVTGFQIEQDRHPLAVDRELHDSIVAMANPPVTAVTVGD